jgi:hypothetical protein
MDFQTILQDASIIASVSTAIFFVIDFIKKLYQKLPWRWTKKTPPEVWFALSILFGVAVAILVYWDNFFGAGATLAGGISSAVYGLVSGAGSKLINSIASSAGAKLKASKLEATSKIEAPISSTIEVPQTETPMGTVETPVFHEEIPKESNVEVVKKLMVDGDYVIIDGSVYKITKEGE